MENELYHFQRPLKGRTTVTIEAEDQGSNLSELVQERGPWTQKEITESYTRQLKLILSMSDLQEMIKSVLALDGLLEKAKSNLAHAVEGNMPDIQKIYQKITPLLLRSLSLHTDFNELKADEFIKDLMEVLRVALEEDVHYWKEQRAPTISS